MSKRSAEHKENSLPIHFFTIVLNGEPFIRHHLERFQKLSVPWHWHIVEGLADLKHDTAWSLPYGGTLPLEMVRDGRSIDGTAEYLDQIAAAHPDQITLHRPPNGKMWDGKLEMVSAPLAKLDCECLLWEIDVDELWTTEQFMAGWQLFLKNPEKTAAFYWCWFFVGPDLVISTRGGYANNPAGEWLRTWRYRPGMRWERHEPPVLAEPISPTQWRNVAAVNPLMHAQTEAAGLVFEHYAYATEAQLRFKERYYGYRNALNRWRALQTQKNFPVFLRDFFYWVNDGTMVGRAETYVPRPLMRLPAASSGGWWSGDEALKQPRIAVDSVFFQFFDTGIARVWRELLRQWAADGFGEHIVILDRVGSAPVIEGIRRYLIPALNFSAIEADRTMLQWVCDQLEIDAFISSYYTCPIRTPSVFTLHDMIPEVAGWDLTNPMWLLKRQGVEHASAVVSVSESSKRDLLRFYPLIHDSKVTVVYNAASDKFYPKSAEEIERFRKQLGVSKPYFLIVGARGGYKNTGLSLEALRQLESVEKFDLVCTGLMPLDEELKRLIPAGMQAYYANMDDATLACAYSGAVALLYPSQYEGFGLPVLEAMCCGCPVITCANSSLPEVAGDSALYVPTDNPQAMAQAMRMVNDPKTRQLMIERGLVQAKKFSWQRTAGLIQGVLKNVTKVKDQNIGYDSAMTTITIQEAFNLALQHHQAGRLADAEAIYRQIINQQPNHADAIHLLGVVAHQAGNNQDAANLISRAIAINSTVGIYHNNLGIVLENQRKFDEAIATYQVAIKLKPDYPEAYNNLGNAFSKKGQLADALAAYQEALRIKPDYAEPYNNMGNVIKDQKRLSEAIESYHTAIKLQPKYAEAHNNLGNALQESGQFEEALAEIRIAIQLKPDLTEAYNNLSNVFRSQNRLDEAVQEINNAIKLRPNFAPLYNILGSILIAQDRLDEAIAALFSAIKLKADYAEGYINLGIALKERGRLNEAVAAYQAALRHKPDFAEAHNSLGMLLQSQALMERAIAEFEAAIKIKPNFIDAYNNLGNAHKSIGRLDTANEVYRRLLKISPEFAVGHNNLGTALLIQGRIDECVAAYRESIKYQPSLAPAHSNLVYAMHFLTDCSPKELYEEHLRWGQMHGEPRKKLIQNHKNNRDPGRRLKIGYVSPDLRGHSVAFFMENLLAQHDAQQFEIFCYADLANPDDVTARLQKLSHHWRDTTRFSDERFAETVRKDGIDILVDLAGHTAGNRLTLFACKPAPIQVTWLGYPDTTGMTAVDYRFTDAYADPPRTAQKFYTEKLIWLKDSFLCYRPLDQAPPVGPAPVLENHGHITFGCFNILSKINVPLAKLWSEILKKTPKSRLLIKSYQGLQDSGGREHLMQKLAEAQIDTSRVELLGLAPTRAEHLKQFNRIDIALDSFPYNGTTTTCDSLWMGVPVITLAGKSHMSRVGVSLLTNVGLKELIAKTPEEYVEIAVKLAGNKAKLTKFRNSIRDMMKESPLMNARAFAKNIEQAYRDIWQKWATEPPEKS